jgi:hypothetical protein
MAQLVGLPVAEPIIIEVDSGFIEHTPALRFQLANRQVAPTPGLQFGSRLVEGDGVVDFLPGSLSIHNVRAFHGMLAFDKWTAQADGRQAVFSRRPRRRSFDAIFIDQGYAFGLDWTFLDSPLRGTYARVGVYERISQWNDFEPWLSRIEHCNGRDLRALALEAPAEWYADDKDLDDLLGQLINRRSQVRNLITSFRLSSRQPFPNWTDTTPDADRAAGMSPRALAFGTA